MHACRPSAAEGRDCLAVLAKMMVDKVVYTQGQLNTGQGGAAGHARIVFRCSSTTQIKPTSAHSSGVVGVQWTGAGGSEATPGARGGAREGRRASGAAERSSRILAKICRIE